MLDRSVRLVRAKQNRAVNERVLQNESVGDEPLSVGRWDYTPGSVASFPSP